MNELQEAKENVREIAAMAVEVMRTIRSEEEVQCLFCYPEASRCM